MAASPDLAALALRGLRVLEIGSGPALAYAGKLFADFGAELIKVEHPAGDAWRQMPPLVDTGADGVQSALFAWLSTNKRSVTADPAEPQDAAWLAQLARSCDIVLDARALSEGPGVLASPVWAGGPDDHAPIAVDFTWFGDSGPYSGYQGTESVCRALAGAVHGSGPVEGPPHMPHDVQTGIVVGLTAFSTAVAAWMARDQGSRRFVLSAHEAIFGVVEMEAGMVQDQRHAPRLGVNRFCGTHPTGIYETADGWIGIFTHTLAQWTALCEAIGHSELALDPRFANGPERMARADAIDALLIAAFRQHSAQHWFERLGAAKHPTVLVPTMAELLRQDVHRQRAAFVPVACGTARFEGPIVPLRLGDAGPAQGGAAPALGAHDAFYRGAGLDHSPQQRLRPAPKDQLPLAGLRIVDLTMGWAGPLASRTLADLGAEVIKIESAVYPDWWRGANFTEEFYRERLYEKNCNFNLMNRNKLGVTLDLTRPEGKQLLLQLVQQADAVIENYSAEVLPKLGLDYAALSAVNERLVMLSMPAFGLGNAWSNTRAYGGTLEQASGLPLYTGHADGPPAMTSYAYGDPIGGFNAGAALLLALCQQQRTGRGQHLNLSQVEAMLPMTAPFMLAQAVHGTVAARSAHPQALRAPHGCYRCAGDDAWIVVSAADDAQRQALSRVLGRTDQAGDAQEELAAWCLTHSADAAMLALQQAGISAGVVRPMAQVLQDPHLRARGFWAEVARAHVGHYQSSTTPYRLHGQPMPIRHAAPTLGEHNDQVLRQLLGRTPAQIKALAQQGITGSSARPKSPGRAP